MGYDENGHCPMFREGACSIYEHRPRTCRTYDCRVFPAAGLEPDGRPGITERARQWRFEVSGPEDEARRAAVHAAAAYLRANAGALPSGAVPGNPTQLAYVAVRIRDVFLKRSTGGEIRVFTPALDVVVAALSAA